MRYHLVVFQSINFHHCRWLYLYGHNLLIRSMDGWFLHIGFKICHGVHLDVITTSYSMKRRTGFSSINSRDESDKFIKLSSEKRARLANEFWGKWSNIMLGKCSITCLRNTCAYVGPCREIKQERINYYMHNGSWRSLKMTAVIPSVDFTCSFFLFYIWCFVDAGEC